MIRLLLAWIHLVALGIGLGAVWTRALALRGSLDRDGLRRVFHSDTLWGVAAVLWLVTGVARAFGGLEKGAVYYLQNHLFLAKMGLFVVILALEVWPMRTLIRWRVRTKLGAPVDTGAARTLAVISFVQAVLILVLVLLAAAMARGFGMVGGATTP